MEKSKVYDDCVAWSGRWYGKEEFAATKNMEEVNATTSKLMEMLAACKLSTQHGLKMNVVAAISLLNWETVAQMESGFNILGKSVCVMVDGLDVQKAKKESVAWERL